MLFLESFSLNDATTAENKLRYSERNVTLTSEPDLSAELGITGAGALHVFPQYDLFFFFFDHQIRCVVQRDDKQGDSNDLP